MCCKILNEIFLQYWENALYHGTDYGNSPQRTASESLIMDFPKLAEIVMDKSCKFQDDEKNKMVFDVKFHEDFFGAQDSKIQDSSVYSDVGVHLSNKMKKFGMAVNNPITAMMHRNHENLFTHPLALIHFRHEFRNYGIFHYLARFLFLAFFVVFFQLFLKLQHNPTSMEMVNNGSNITICEMYKAEDQCGWEHWNCSGTAKEPNFPDTPFSRDSKIYFEYILLIIFFFRLVNFFCFYEVVQLCHVWNWLKDEELREKVLISLSEMTLMCSAMYVVWETDGPVQNGKKFTSCGAWQLGVFIFPLMLTLLLFLSKNFLFMVPKIGKYVLVFYGVFLRTIMVLGMLVMPIYGFLYVSYMNIDTFILSCTATLYIPLRVLFICPWSIYKHEEIHTQPNQT